MNSEANNQINRLLLNLLQETLTATQKSIMLLGPRQVGKSSLMKRLNPQLIVNLANQKTYLSLQKDPDLIVRQVKSLEPGSIVFIDEIQRIPELLNTIQSLIDDFPKKWLFVFTGSSARKLKKHGVNLLPGRIFSYRLFPLLYWELESLFILEKTLTYGNLPEVYLQKYGPDLLQEYVNIYLREEIQAEALVRNVHSFARFLDIAAERSGQVVNFSSIASDTEIPKETVRRYYSILEDTLLIERIPGYTGLNSPKKASQKEKILFFDVGVRNAILGRTENAMSSEELGHLFEQWAILQIMALHSYLKVRCKFFYFRDEQKNEVDFIIDYGDKITAVEIKYATKAKAEHFKGLKKFAQIAPKPVTSYLVFRGEHPEKWDNISALPYQKFFDMLKTKLV